jgi:hypothetical protein
MAQTKMKTTSRVNGKKVGTGELVMKGATQNGTVTSKVRFGTTVVSASSPKQVDLRRNVHTGQAALARVATKIVKAGVSLPTGGSVPLYRADPQDSGRLIRELNGRISMGVFVGGKFKVTSKR